MANTNYYPDGYVVIPLKEYNKLLQNRPIATVKTTIEPQKESNTYHKGAKGETHAKVMQMHHMGMTNREIAIKLGVSDATVCDHIKRERRDG